MTIDFSSFQFPEAKTLSVDDIDGEVTPQMLHDLCAALGATCKHCQPRKAKRAKALHRGSSRADVMVLARAKLRRLALLQAVAETHSL